MILSAPCPYRRLTIDRLNDEGVINVFSEMLSQAATDFKEAFIAHRCDPSDEVAESQYIEARRFFLSEYVHALTRVDGRKIIAKLERIAIEEAAANPQSVVKAC